MDLADDFSARAKFQRYSPKEDRKARGSCARTLITQPRLRGQHVLPPTSGVYLSVLGELSSSRKSHPWRKGRTFGHCCSSGMVHGVFVDPLTILVLLDICKSAVGPDSEPSAQYQPCCRQRETPPISPSTLASTLTSIGTIFPPETMTYVSRAILLPNA